MSSRERRLRWLGMVVIHCGTCSFSTQSSSVTAHLCYLHVDPPLRSVQTLDFCYITLRSRTWSFLYSDGPWFQINVRRRRNEQATRETSEKEWKGRPKSSCSGQEMISRVFSQNPLYHYILFQSHAQCEFIHVERARAGATHYCASVCQSNFMLVPLPQYHAFAVAYKRSNKQWQLAKYFFFVSMTAKIMDASFNR